MKVLLMPWGRVGSNLLLDIMSQSDAVGRGDFRLFNEPLTGIRTRSPGPEVRVFLEQLYWIEQLRRRERRGKQGEAVVNLSLLSFAYRRLLVPCLRRGTGRILYLDRRNVVKTAVSIVLAHDYARAHEEAYGFKTWTRRPHAAKKMRLPTPAPGPVQLSGIIDLLEKARRGLHRLRATFPGELLYYEDIKEDLPDAMRRLWAALDLAPHAYRPRLSKAVWDDLSQSLANFEDLAAALPTPYRAQLLEGSGRVPTPAGSSAATAFP